MSTEPRDIIAQAIRDGRGHRFDGKPYTEMLADFALAALTAAGYELVKLPAPVETQYGREWPVNQHRKGTPMRPGSVYIRSADGLISSTSVHNPNDGPEDARSLAAALLAAAKAVEGQ